MSFRPGDGQEGEGSGSEYYRFDERHDDNGECRAKKFIRFVSNAPPDAAHLPVPPNVPQDPTDTPEYDDEYNDKQTIRVELGDDVLFTVEKDGDLLPVQNLQLHVGLTSSQPEPDAIRVVEVHWNTLSGLSSAPDLVTDRMSEDFAQASIRFENAGETASTEVQNVLRLRIAGGADPDPANPIGYYHRWRPASGGTIGVQATLAAGAVINASYTYTVDESLYQIVEQLRNDIHQESGGVLNVGNTPVFVDRVEPMDVYILVDKGNDVTFAPPTSSLEIDLDREFEVNYKHLYGPLAQAVAMNHRDGVEDVLTMDIVVVQKDALWMDASTNVPLNGIAFIYDGDDYPGFLRASNAFLLDVEAANAVDDYPATAGHEAGHILLRGNYPGADPNDPRHDGDTTNLLFPGAESRDAETYTYHKRLTLEQAEDIREEHDPGHSSANPDQPRLLQIPSN